jgi:hypothetical protein
MTNIIHENLAKTCVLASISLSRWQGKKVDVKASERVADEAKANRKSTYVTKRLVSDTHCPSFKAIQTLDGHIRNNIFYRRAAPTPILNTRLLTSASLAKFISEVDPAFEERQGLIDKLVDEEYPEFLKLAQDYLGSLFDDADFPTPAQVRAKYAATRTFTPLSDSNPALVGFPEEVAESIATQAAAQHDHLRDIAQDSIAPRLYQALADFSETMREFSIVVEGTGEERKEKRINPFRDSKVSKLVDRAEDCVDLDLSIDRKLAAFADRVHTTFRYVTPEDLRTMRGYRMEAAGKADRFINEMIDLGFVDSEGTSKRAKPLEADPDVYVPEIDDLNNDLVQLAF